MKYIDKLYVKIVIAIVIGILFAGAGTKTTYDCQPLADEPNSGCVSYEKAVMHPGDLFSNKQDSLMRFSKLFVITSFASVMIFNSVSLFLKQKA